MAFVGGTRIDLAALAANGAALAANGATLAEGDAFEIELQACDSRPRLADGAIDPAAVGSAPSLRVRIVSDDEFLRRLQDRLAKVRAQVTDLDLLQRQRSARTSEVLAALESDAIALNAAELSNLLTGQRRVQGDAEALTREFASVFEGVLYARIDEQGAAFLEALDTGLAQATVKGFPLATWQNLVGLMRAGRLTPQGLSGQLAHLFELALSVSSEDSARAVDALDSAARELETSEVHAALTLAKEQQETARRHLAELLDRLAEWDNFQSILSLTRDILNRQKSLLDSTKQMSGADRK